MRLVYSPLKYRGKRLIATLIWFYSLMFVFEVAREGLTFLKLPAKIRLKIRIFDIFLTYILHPH